MEDGASVSAQQLLLNANCVFVEGLWGRGGLGDKNAAAAGFQGTVCLKTHWSLCLHRPRGFAKVVPVRPHCPEV